MFPFAILVPEIATDPFAQAPMMEALVEPYSPYAQAQVALFALTLLLFSHNMVPVLMLPLPPPTANFPRSIRLIATGLDTLAKETTL